ncbi:MAG TPA: hypothetical protein VF429_08015 [Anaerolineae bacterium]
MTTLARTLQKNSLPIYAALFVALAALLVFSPAEATLGNVVKIVYAHGAAERVSTYAYLLAGALGLVALSLRALFAKQSPIRDLEIASSQTTLLAMTESVAHWTRAVAETAILFWLAQFVISAPAQVLAWGAFTFDEPRVASAVWILALTGLVYLVARWIDEPGWLAFAAIANAVIVILVLRGAINILHPVDPIVGSDSIAIKVFYAAIVLVTGAIALQFARDRAENLAKARKPSQG